MNFTGRLCGVNADVLTGETTVTFSVNEREAVYEIEKIRGEERLTIKAEKYRKKRSLDANGLLWACLGEMAAALGADKWDIYLKMLKRYGKYTYICVKPNVVEAIRREWRCSEVIGDIEINGQPAVQMLCYFGSSTYDSKEFSVLLDGVVSEMKEMELQPPMGEELRGAIEELERHEAAEKRLH